MKKTSLILVSAVVMLGMIGCSKKEKASITNSSTIASSSVRFKEEETKSSSKQTDQLELATSAPLVELPIAENTITPTAPVEEIPITTNWDSINDAITFYENTYKNSNNAISQDITWENYDSSCWSLVELSGNKIVLHWSNIGGAGGSYNEFIKEADVTTMITYGGNASYPNSPSYRYIINNDDFSVVSTEELWR